MALIKLTETLRYQFLLRLIKPAQQVTVNSPH